MIGEFYVGTLLNLHVLFTTSNNRYHNHHNSSTIASSNQSFEILFRSSPMKHNIQFYLHIPLENKRMVDAHKILLSGMLPPTKDETNNLTLSSIRWAKPVLDLITPKNKACECFNKLVFCGYNAYAQYNEIANSQDISNSSSRKKETNYTLWTGKFIDVFGRHIAMSPTCNGSRGVTSYPYHCDAYAKLRDYLVTNIESKHFPNAKQTIIEYRKKILVERQLIDTNYDGNTEEWKFVGLTQRNSRRTWLNLANVTDACNSIFNQQNLLLCLEVNVEETESPVEQYMMYRSLDVCIGVHGAQLTQAIFMKAQSHVLELLPWIPVS